MLKDYNSIKAELDKMVKLLEITELNLELFDEEGEVLKAPAYEPDMPVHFGNEFNSKTENVVCKREMYISRIIMLKIKIEQEGESDNE